MSTITSPLGGAVVITQRMPCTALTTVTQTSVEEPSTSTGHYKPAFIASFIDDLPAIDLDNYFADKSGETGDPS
ncbi:hypothetical protein [Endozoicomonas euniceicola]|uniref:Uncharacterized protein n=1 Tax=Endozoicomonas euniceicola TaxID=1234143 RepID=A0ABY6GZK4_9GAMM|nr:hypothetical protein [Endozoicomonas euniceicola]UYM18245.1 hypothetical protein NX720_10180 [Endozoicomonas euniceicola]